MQRFSIPGDRWLTVTPEQLRGHWVRMQRAALEGRAAGDDREPARLARRAGHLRGPPLWQGGAHHHPVGEPESRRAPASRRSREGPVSEERYREERARIEQGHVKYRAKLKEEGKLFVRDRLRLLLDPGSDFQEDFLFARNQEPDTPADGVVTGVGRVGGRTVCIMANDYTVKAGSWGEKTVQKIVRIQERAQRLGVPLLYLVDAAGGRISEQIKIFPGPLPRRPHLLQRGPALRRRPPGLHPLRAVARGLRVSPRAHRLRDHGRRQGEPLRRIAADGRDGHRREDDPRGARRGAHALLRVGVRGRPGRVRRGRHRALQALPLVHAGLVLRAARRRSRVCRRSPAAPSRRSCPTTSASGSTCTR